MSVFLARLKFWSSVVVAFVVGSLIYSATKFFNFDKSSSSTIVGITTIIAFIVSYFVCGKLIAKHESNKKIG